MNNREYHLRTTSAVCVLYMCVRIEVRVVLTTHDRKYDVVLTSCTQFNADIIAKSQYRCNNYIV